MDIDTHLLWDLEELERQDASIGDDDEIVTLIRPECIEKIFIIANFRRSKHWYILLGCERLYRTRSHDLISSERLIRIRDGADDLYLGLIDQISEYRSS